MNSLQTAFIKLFTLAGVIAGGCFVVLHVQEGIGDLATPANANPLAAALTPGPMQSGSSQADVELADAPHADPFSDGVAPTGDEPFQANIPELAAGTKSEPTLAPIAQPALAEPSLAEPTLAEPKEETLLAQATAPNPFDFGSTPGPTPAPVLVDEPNPFDPTGGNPAKPIGRESLQTLSPIESSVPANRPLPSVIPRGAAQPLPTMAAPQNGPTIIPAGATGNGNGLQAIPDPFALDLPPVQTPAPAAQPIPTAPQPAMTNPRPAPQPANDPFSLDLDPVAPEPIRSASAVTQPRSRETNANDPSFDLAPMPFDATSPGPVGTPPATTGQPSLTIDEPRRPQPAATSDFLGDATIDREVPRGTVHPQVQMTKTAPERAVIGEAMVYEIQLVNTGTSAARTVVVEDRIPRGTKLLGTIPQAEMPEGSKRLVWRFESLRPGEAKNLRIQVEPVEAGQIGSIATVRFVAETAAETRVAAPELKFRLVGEQEAALGEKLSYKFEIANTGDEDARDVLIRCLIPQGLQGPNHERDLEHPIGTIPAKQSKTVDLPVAAVEVGDFTTEALVEAVGVSPIQATSKIRIIKSRLALNRTGPGKRFVGSKVQFTNSVTNNSSRPLTDVKVSEALPPNVTFESASDGGQAAVGSVNWTIASLAPGETRDISVTFIPNDAGEKVSTVTAVAADESQAAIRAKMMVVGFAALKVENDRELRPYSVGEQVSMRMTIKNGGTASANAVAAVVRVPENLRFVKADGPVKYTPMANTISFQPISEIPNGQDVSIDLVFDCVSAGDAHVDVQLQSSDLEKPILSQEAFVIVGE